MGYAIGRNSEAHMRTRCRILPNDLGAIVRKTIRHVARLIQASLFWTALCFPSHCISQTIYAFGAGTDSCNAYVAQAAALPGKSVSRIAPDDGRDYYSKSTIYLEWLLGFITAYNAGVSDHTKQVQINPAAVDLYVRGWCAQNPTSNIFTAVHQFLNTTDP
jgi:hypothetical protein